MTGFHRLDAPLPLTGLLALEYDGLLQRLTHDVWVSRGTVTDPRLRTAALGEPPRPRLTLSHRSAHWIWWGSTTGRAPALTEYTTLARRRMRASTATWTVYERDVPPSERVDVSGTWVTSPERTLFDLLRDTTVGADPLRAARSAFARVPDQDRLAFLAWLDRNERRPFIARTRALAFSAVRRQSSDAHPVGVEDPLDAADCGEHVVEMRAVPQLEDEPRLRDPGPRRRDGRGEDVHVQLREHPRDV